MTPALKLFKTLTWFSQSVRFFKSHFLTIFGLGLVAAFGRAIQLGAFGPVTTSSHLLLETAIESARVLIFLFALGVANVRTGAIRALRLITNGAMRRKNWNLAVQKIKKQWVALLLNLVVFLVSAWLINLLIDYAAYQTCLYAKLKANQVIAEEASEWTVILFFKNISVIPFTLVFNALFVLWTTRKLSSSMGSDQKVG